MELAHRELVVQESGNLEGLPSAPDVITQLLCAKPVPSIKLTIRLKMTLEEATRYAGGKLAYRCVLGQYTEKERLEEAIV